MTVIFLRPYGSYAIGQSASFTNDTENSLIQQGFARISTISTVGINTPFDAVEGGGVQGSSFPIPADTWAASRGLPADIGSLATQLSYLQAASNAALPALPLAAGARLMGLGDSLVQFNASSIDTLAVSSSASGSLEAAVSSDPRVNFDYWYDPLTPWAGVVGAGILWNGANQGIAGDHLVDNRVGRGGGIAPRVTYSLARNPQIIWLNAGSNSISSGDSDSSDPGAYGGSNNGCTAQYVIGKLDAIIAQIVRKGVYVILSTLFPRADWPSGDARHQVMRDVNVWIRAQAGRAGVVVSDPYAALVSSTDPDGINTALFQTDLVHPNPAGAAVIGIQYILPAIQSLVAAGSVFNQDPTVSNLYPAATALMNGGTSGTLSNGATGVAPTGYLVGLATSVSNELAVSIEDAGTYKRTVLSVTPVDNGAGNAYHNATLTIPQVSPFSGASVGDWMQFFVHIECNDAVGSSIVAVNQVGLAQGSTVAVQQRIGTENSPLFSVKASGRGGYWLIGKPFQIPTGATFDRIRPAQVQVYWARNMLTPFTVKIDRPILRKITDPRTAWGLP